MLRGCMSSFFLSNEQYINKKNLKKDKKKATGFSGSEVIGHSGPVRPGGFFFNISSNSAITILALENDKITHRVGGVKR